MMCGSTIENLKQIEGQSTDFFELKLYLSYLTILMNRNSEMRLINQEIEFAKSKFSNNPIFYYCEYFLKIKKFNEVITSEILKLREDMEIIKQSNNSIWNMYFPIESLEVIMIKLLMKSERYELAHDLFSSSKELYIESGLATEESDFF